MKRLRARQDQAIHQLRATFRVAVAPFEKNAAVSSSPARANASAGEGDRPRVRPKAGPSVNSAVEGAAADANFLPVARLDRAIPPALERVLSQGSFRQPAFLPV